MTPLERLFRLEVEFHRRLRTDAPGTVDVAGLHTSYALQSGYEPLIQSAAKEYSTSNAGWPKRSEPCDKSS